MKRVRLAVAMAALAMLGASSVVAAEGVIGRISAPNPADLHSEHDALGSGGRAWVADSIDLARLPGRAIGYGETPPLLPWDINRLRVWLAFGPPLHPDQPVVLRRIALEGDLLSDSQFVWGPQDRDFAVKQFLESLGSPLAAYSAEVELWSAFSSVNPKVLLAVLELRHGWIGNPSASVDPASAAADIEDAAMDLAGAFYDHLYTWGSRRGAAPPGLDPVVTFADGSAAEVQVASSGTYAVAVALAEPASFPDWQAMVEPTGKTGFAATYAALFPGSDPLSSPYDINPASAPAPDLLQFPFPLGSVWAFAGPHSWNGGSFPPPFSSIDFYAGGATCQAPPGLFSVAAATGSATRPFGYNCWLELDHGSGWTTSYYHLRNTYSGAPLNRNGKVGTISCEICAGGFATGPHVHFSLKYNGAYVSLEGVRLSGWTVHVGPVAYDTGWLERDGILVDPYSQILNDYHVYYFHGDFSARFYGNGAGDIDRFKIRMTDLNAGGTGPPADVGAQDFTIEWWMKALPGDNNSPPLACGANLNWVYGNTMIDRDRYNQDRKYGVSLAGGAIAFGVSGQGTGDRTICGSTDLRDGQWHHVAVQRRRSDGFLWLFVDGSLQASSDGPDGDISYPENAVPGNFCGPTGDQPCSNDPFLVLGAEKHDVGPSSPSFSGWMDEFRMSNTLRYSANFTRPAAPFPADGNTLVLIRFDEGSGDNSFDISGFPGGPSNAARRAGGLPEGPEWSIDTPFGPPVPTATPSATFTASATPSPSATPTATRTVTPASTASPSTPTPTATPAFPTGDLNQDGLVDIIDLQLCVNVVLGTEVTPAIVSRADLNADGAVNILDVQSLVNAILAA